MGGTTSTVDLGLQAQRFDQESKTQYCTDMHASGAVGRTEHKGYVDRENSEEGWVDSSVVTPQLAHGRSHSDLGQLRAQPKPSKFRIFSDGVVFEGPDFHSSNSHDLARDFARITKAPIARLVVGDSRAQQVLVAYADNKYWAVPSRQSFSRHSGVCLILGDKSNRGSKHKLKVGDILRLGSVGLLVSEMNLGDNNGNEMVRDDILQQIRDEVEPVPRQILAPLREDFKGLKDEYMAEPVENVSENGQSRYQCYICMESQECDDNPLIAPCECKGSTAFLHVSCLQKMINTGDGNRINVISTKHEKHTCKICKARYKTHVKLKKGKVISLLSPALQPPYISLIVVTKHDSSPDLFNTIFQLSFNRTSDLIIGRSQACEVVLGYRTVSTRHAMVSFCKGEFFYQDLRSSNGSLLYLNCPIELPYGKTVRLRMGRSIITLKARRSLSLPARAALASLRWATGGRSSSSSNKRGGADEESAEKDERRKVVVDANTLKQLYEGRFSGGGKLDSMERILEDTEHMGWGCDISSSASDHFDEETHSPDAEGLHDDQDQPSLDDLREETWLPDAEEGITRGHEEFDTSFIPLNPPVTMQTRHYRSDTEVPEPRAQDIGVSRSRSSA